MTKFLHKLWCTIIHRCPKCGERLACNDNDFGYGLWYCPNCDGDCETGWTEEVGGMKIKS